MRHRTPFFAGWGLMLLVVVACSAPKETAVVTVRPEPIASTESVPIPSADRLTAALTPFPEGFENAQAGRFDKGKMWTFENPPMEYFAEKYGFQPDSAWFEKARLGALRFSTYCSASFVSPQGLIMTNHHCARQSITDVSTPGESLLDNGFYAVEQADERKVEDLHVDQLVAIEDVTALVYAAAEDKVTMQDRASARSARSESIATRMTNEAKSTDSTLYVQVIELYNGGKYSAYTFRRYDDVRLVMAPALDIGYFGGDPDNFTYPRYNFDMAFFRAFAEDGSPVMSTHYFPWQPAGSSVGEAVFVVGNPGSTSRLSTVAQLVYERDSSVPNNLAALRKRAGILKTYMDAQPDSAEEYGIRNAYFSLANSIKATEGQLRGLEDDALMAQRTASERALQEAIFESDSLEALYGDIYEEIRALQTSKETTARRAEAFNYFLSSDMSSHLVQRAVYAYYLDIGRQRGAPPEWVANLKETAQKVTTWPEEVEVEYIVARLEDMQRFLGDDDPTVRRLLDGTSPQAYARQLVDSTALMDSTRYVEMLEEGYLSSKDATIDMVRAIEPIYRSLSGQYGDLLERERELQAQLAQARFAVFGEGAPPDATFSLRLADGVVQGYEYNGTVAPAYTTLFGLYSHYYSYEPTSSDWELPAVWLERRDELDLRAPVNLVTTNDITGGNSGSPLLNQNLEVVGLIFDSNIEALPNEYLYRDERERAVSVDVRGMLEVIRTLYQAERLAEELVPSNTP